MGTYFGTDGIRGVAGELLTPEFAVQVGRAAAVVLAQKAGPHPLFVIGRDTRLSGPMLEAGLVAGLTSGGARVEIAGVIPTPGLATLVHQRGADAGVVISASHNPFADNSIKFFSGAGVKLSDEEEAGIEAHIAHHDLQSLAGAAFGSATTLEGAVEGYVWDVVPAQEPGREGGGPKGRGEPRSRLRSVCQNALQIGLVVYIFGLTLAILLFKSLFVSNFQLNPFFTVYGLVVTLYIFSRFLTGALYRPTKDQGYEPSVAIVMPAFNEGDAVARSIHSLLEVRYPREKLEIVAVDDGSTDDTRAVMRRCAAVTPDCLRLIEFPENRGKRAAMAAGIRATSADIVVFVDSDCTIDPDSVRILVQDFANPRVGAVAGHADVENVQDSWLTRMQCVRYYIAFTIMKASESLVGAVTCCSGCFSGYRRSALMPHLEKWERQRFLGLPATFGDDRSLTNFVLRHYRVVYQTRAVSRTVVPSTLWKFMRQQARWKRSWTRESLISCRFIWRKHPLAAVFTYISVALPLFAPIAATRALLWRPLVDHAGVPVVYIMGTYAVAILYGLYYELKLRPRDGLWIYGVLFVFFYLVFLVWQTYYAILTSRTSSWGTRTAEPTVPGHLGAGQSVEDA